MTQRTLSEREKNYIREHARTKFKRQIAIELGELFPQDNGGSRSSRTIRLFIQREGLED